MSDRRRFGSVLVVLALLAVMTGVAGVAAGQATQNERLHREPLDSLTAQQEATTNESDTGDAATHLATARATVERTVVTRNESVNVTASVRNERLQAITESITLAVDGEPLRTRYVSVPANATSTVVFTTAFAEVGVHNVSVGNASAMLGVTKPPSARPEPTHPTIRTASPTATTEHIEASGVGPLTFLLGVTAAIVVLVGLVGLVAVLAVRRVR